jgi:hypothetical protein
VASTQHWRPLPAISAAALLLAGCATSSATAQGPAPPITNLSSYRALSLPTDAVRLATAIREARALLNAARIPPGGIEATASTKPSLASGDPNYVTVSRTYVVKTLPRHLGAAFLPEGAVATIRGSSPTSSQVGFTYPNVKWPDSRTLLFTMQRAAHGYSVRIDAEVTWVAVKPFDAYVRPGASRVGVALTSEHHVIGATVTSSSTIQGITGVVNAMPAAPTNGVVGGCLGDGGTSTLTISFWHSGAMHPYARVVMDPACEGVAIIHYRANGTVIARGTAASAGAGIVIARLAGVAIAPAG